MLITFFYLKSFLLQLQCPLFNPTSILLHRGLALIILLSPTAITSERCCYIKDEDKRFLLKTYPMTATLHPPTNPRNVVMIRQRGKKRIQRNIER